MEMADHRQAFRHTGDDAVAIPACGFRRQTADGVRPCGTVAARGKTLLEITDEVIHVSTAAVFGTELDERNAFHDAPLVDIEARDHTLGEHATSISVACSTSGR